MSEVAATAYWHQFAGRIVPFGSCKIADNTIFAGIGVHFPERHVASKMECCQRASAWWS